MKLFRAWALGLLAVLLAGRPVFAQPAYTVEQSSPPIHTRGVPVVVAYTPPQPLPNSAAMLRVQVQLSGQTRVPVQARVCVDLQAPHCMEVNGASATTSRFYGVPANRPVYLVYTVPGEGPLDPNVYVRGSVTVWYGQASLPSSRSSEERP
ncbi:flagellar protein FlhE [Pusillimonas sp. DMV24BSW_D]|uniref:flagellar protein FlhE n=1 Tax=Neopusillimonas aestuarii TaxID=2716226 RepID=UPI00140C29D1|nr:flagellar protein FlhE [Pusillimonas sp. DMV24BSW_D]QIM49412.1 flagellar protein FlhE [Pusillimonas sp. DMV24BSW_D]